MKFTVLHTLLLLLALTATVFMSGCKPNASSSSTDPKMSDADAKLAEAAKAKRDEYAREMQLKLDELDAKYKALEKRAADAKGEERKQLDEKVVVAKAKRDAAIQKLAELKTTSHDRWEKVKEGVGNAFDDLKKIFD